MYQCAHNQLIYGYSIPFFMLKNMNDKLRVFFVRSFVFTAVADDFFLVALEFQPSTSSALIACKLNFR